MQAEGNQTRLQEEVGRMLHQLEEERKVTANLSKNLELERRKVGKPECVENCCNCAGGVAGAEGQAKQQRSSEADRRRSSLQCTALHWQRCDNLDSSLHAALTFPTARLQ